MTFFSRVAKPRTNAKVLRARLEERVLLDLAGLGGTTRRRRRLLASSLLWRLEDKGTGVIESGWLTQRTKALRAAQEL